MKVNAKKPYTIEGIPARSSKMGFTILRVFLEANSLRYIALPKPKGKDIKLDKTAIRKVPDNKGNTPKEGGSKTGAHLSDVKNSTIETTLKNS